MKSHTTSKRLARIRRNWAMRFLERVCVGANGQMVFYSCEGVL